MKKANLITLKIEKDNSFQSVKISNALTAYGVIKNFWSDDLEIYESMFILLLNRANGTIGWAKIGQGGVAGCHVDVKLIAKYAIDSLANGVILAHNHPSGNATPSDQDIRITKQIRDGLKLLDTTLIDHLILTSNGYHSMADYGDF